MNTLPTPGRFDENAENRLLRRRAELQTLLQDAAGAAVHAAEEPAELSDFKELAGHEMQGSISDLATEHAARELTAIATALRRIREGSYGVCEECGDVIAPARLLAVPAATLCPDCQARRERRPLRRA